MSEPAWVALGAVAFPSEDTVLYVSGSGSAANDGLSWAKPFRQVQEAITALPALGGTIYVGDGNYAPFTLTDAKARVQVIATGAAQISPGASQFGIQINASGAGGTPVVGPLVEGFVIDGTTGGGLAGSAVGIRLAGMSRATIRRCRIANCLIGIDLFNDASLFTERNSVENTLINDCGTGVRFIRTVTGNASFSYNRFWNVAVDRSTLAWDLGTTSAAVPALYGSNFTGCACWLQNSGAVGVGVGCDMLGVHAHIDVEWQAGASAIGWNVTAQANNLDKCLLESVLIGNWTAATRIQLATGKTIRFLSDDDEAEIRSIAEGMRGQNFTREMIQGTSLLTLGTIQGGIVPMRRGDVVTGIVVGVSVNGTGVTLFKLGLYSSVTPAGLLAQSAESSALVNAGTVSRFQQIPLVTPFVVPDDGLYNLVVLAVGGTAPTLIRGVNLAASSGKVGSGHYPHWQSAGGQTDLQAAHNQNQTGTAFWFGWY